MKTYKNIDATAILVDLRDFTHLYEEFQKKDINILLNFMEEYYNLVLETADKAKYKNDYYVNSTGDGVLVVYFGYEHEKSCYLFGLILYQILEKFCNRFNMDNDCNISYGIGMAAGTVKRIIAKTKHGKISSYLGSIINTAARIEATTKQYHRTKFIMGEEVYRRLVKKLFDEEYETTVMDREKYLRNYKEAVNHYNKMSKINQKLMLFYIFEHKLKGVEKPLPLYRLSPTLSDMKENTFFKVIKMLSETTEHYENVTLFLDQKIDAL